MPRSIANPLTAAASSRRNFRSLKIWAFVEKGHQTRFYLL
jgi:hypothetical protein